MSAIRPIANRYYTISTASRQADSVSAAELRNAKAIFYTDQTRATLMEEQLEFFDEVSEPGSGYQLHSRRRTITTSRLHWPQRSQIPTTSAGSSICSCSRMNLPHYDAWLKSTATRFYEIDYAWKKREHPKRGKFNPDFFIKAGDLIIVVEVKGDEELQEPSEENRKKNEYAVAHFRRINEYLVQEGSPVRYKFTFLTPASFNKFFQSLRDGTIVDFRSELDVRLTEEG